MISSIPVLRAELHVTAMYRRNFNPKIFTDITTPVKQSYSPNTGKVSQVLTSPIFVTYSQCICNLKFGIAEIIDGQKFKEYRAL